MGWRDEGVRGEGIPGPCGWGADAATARIEGNERCGYPEAGIEDRSPEGLFGPGFVFCAL